MNAAKILKSEKSWTNSFGGRGDRGVGRRGECSPGGSLAVNSKEKQVRKEQRQEG